MNEELEFIETSDLIEELKDRGHSVDKTLDDFDSDDLESELEKRGYAVYERPVDLDDFDSDDLESELEKRGYAVYERPVDLDDFDSDDIISYVESDGYTLLKGESLEDHLSNLPSYKLRDLFCDMVGVNHHTPKDKLMKLLSEKI